MKLEKKKFLESEFGEELECTITAWDQALEKSSRTGEDKENLKTLARCQAQWKVYRLAIKHFYGVEYYFTRTDEYYGLCTEDESDWLMKVDRELTSCSKPALDTETDIDKVVEATTQSACEMASKITYHATAEELGQALRNLRCQHS